MALSSKRWLVLVLLLAVPVQGIAATFTAMVCAAHADHAASAHAGHATHLHGPLHDHSSDTRGAADQHQGHQCCHDFSSSAVLAAPAVIATNDLPLFHGSLSLLQTLFIPEQPQRPPRL